MRTNIEIEDQLMDEILELGTHKTKKEAVHAGLVLLLQREQQKKIRDLRGKLSWEGDLESFRVNDDIG